MSTKKRKSDTDLPGRLPKGTRLGSYLVDETRTMERERRLHEQQGHRQLAKVHARDHQEEQQSDLEGELQESMMQHPNLDTQRFDGLPPIGTEERRKFDKEIEKQKDAKELRLGLTHTPKFSTAPKPRGPG